MASVPDLTKLDVPAIVDFVKEAALTTEALASEVKRLQLEVQDLTAKAAATSAPVPAPSVPPEAAVKVASMLVERELVLPAHQAATAESIQAGDPVKMASLLQLVLERIPGATTRPDGQGVKLPNRQTPGVPWS